MEDALVLVSHSDAVRTLTLNRPHALNSFTGALHGELAAALEAAAVDRQVRCVVLTGAGRGFCAGQDLGDPAVAPNPAAGVEAADVGDAIERYYRPLALRIRSMPVPVIAAVNGVAAGAGANIALLCDVVIAARSASFIQAFVKIGLLPDAGGTWLLPRLVGRAKAMGLAMFGEKLTAEEAERIGLIWKCVDDAAFAADVSAAATRLAALPTRAIFATRLALDAGQAFDLAGSLDHEAKAQRALGKAADFLEGVAAFKAKRPARFSDR